MSNRIDKLVDATEGPTVLDLGAVQHDRKKATNDDWLHGQLCDEFCNVIGVDILESDVRSLRKQGYDIRHADVETMELDIQSDTIVAGELIEHVSNPGLMLDRVGEHLKPDGKLLLTTPNPWAIVHLRRHFDGSFHINEEHTGWYGPQTLRQLLDRHGFEVKELSGVGPPHRGLTGLAQAIGSDVFGATTWFVIARRTW